MRAYYLVASTLFAVVVILFGSSAWVFIIFGSPERAILSIAGAGVAAMFAILFIRRASK